MYVPVRVQGDSVPVPSASDMNHRRCGTCSVCQHVAVRQVALAIRRLDRRLQLRLRLRRDTCGLCRVTVSLERTKKDACVSKARMNVCRLAHHGGSHVSPVQP